MASKSTDIIAIVISLIALFLSGFGFYFQFIKTSPDVKYIEGWSIVRPPSSVELGGDKALNLKKLYEFIGSRFFLTYAINITNSGNEETDEIKITLNNLPEIKSVFQGRCKALAQYPCLSITPSTLDKPDYENNILTLQPVPAGMTVNIKVTISLPEGKTSIVPSEVPHITNFIPSEYSNYSPTSEPFEYGSIDALAIELSKASEYELQKYKKLVELYEK